MLARLSIPALLACLLFVAACGGGDGEPATVCATIDPGAVTAELRRAGAATPARLSAEPDESPGLSVCRFSGRGTSVRISDDSAPQAPLRYFHRIVEQFEFHAGDPEREPNLVFGVGDDKRAFGGAGAYWVPANGQLISQRDDRVVIVTLSAPGVSGDRERAAAERLALRVYGGGEPAARRNPAERKERQLTVITPRDGAEVREQRVLVEGTVSPPDTDVRVGGQAARVADGVFKRTVALEQGSNRIAIESAAGNDTLTVKRLSSPEKAVEAVVRSADGRVPDLRGERLDIARAALRRLGIRFIEVELTKGRVVAQGWSACGSRPPAGEQPPRGRRLVLLIAKRRLDRASGTACREE